MKKTTACQNETNFGSVHQVCRRGDRRVLQIFQKISRSIGDQRPKYFMVQYFFQKIFHGPSHQF